MRSLLLYDDFMSTHKMQEDSLRWKSYVIHTWHMQPEQLLENSPTVVMLHGAGTSDSTRSEGLARAFADCGVRVISFDFVGHGKSTGKVSEMSLKLRTDVASAVIEHWTATSDKLVLCGFSMSGHTALMLTERLGERVQAISLMAAGTYAAQAENVLFTKEFSSIIRKEYSWQDSSALKNAEKFQGKVYMLTSSHDEVIPWGVAEHLLRAFRKNAVEVRFDALKEPGHKLAIWLSERPSRGRDIMRYLLADG